MLWLHYTFSRFHFQDSMLLVSFMVVFLVEDWYNSFFQIHISVNNWLSCGLEAPYQVYFWNEILRFVVLIKRLIKVFNFNIWLLLAECSTLQVAGGHFEHRRKSI